MPDVLLAPDKAAAIEADIDMLEAVAAELRLKLENARAAQADLETGSPLPRSTLRYVVLDNLRIAQSGPMVRALAALGRLMYALADAEDAVPL